MGDNEYMSKFTQSTKPLTREQKIAAMKSNEAFLASTITRLTEEKNDQTEADFEAFLANGEGAEGA